MNEPRKNKIHYANEAIRDMDAIWDYIAFELENPNAAERIVDHILDTVAQLEDFAESGTLLSSIADVDSNYRFLVSDHYLIFYRTDGSTVYVDRVLYRRRNYLRVLFGDTAEIDTTQ